MTRNDIELALTNGLLWARMANGNLWRVRRNGATKVWKRDTARFEIPVKVGLKSCTRIAETSVIEPEGDGRFIIERF